MKARWETFINRLDIVFLTDCTDCSTLHYNPTHQATTSNGTPKNVIKRKLQYDLSNYNTPQKYKYQLPTNK